MQKPDNPARDIEKNVKYPSIDSLNPNSNRSWEENPGWYIQEKIDGSQMSFCLNPLFSPLVENKELPLMFFNKGTSIKPENQVFVKAINLLCVWARKNWELLNTEPLNTFVWHGEAVCSSRHNVVPYERAPHYYFILYDIDTPDGLMNCIALEANAKLVGLEAVPTLVYNSDPHRSPYQTAQELVEQIAAGKITSILGGRPEGVVLKHPKFVAKGKTVATKLKLVTSEFKEAHGMKQNRERATPDTAIEEVGKAFSLPARYHKALQHLRDTGKLKGTMEDVVKIKTELDEDLEREHREEIMMYLYAELAQHVKRAARTGFDDWYRTQITPTSEESKTN